MVSKRLYQTLYIYVESSLPGERIFIPCIMRPFVENNFSMIGYREISFITWGNMIMQIIQ